jgi:antitoxin (DNA-binding transcriptional repressor) of toxin-antitoxin stability system
MKAINVTELKAHLSRYLRLASRGTAIIVKERDEPIAQIGPLPAVAQPWRVRLIDAGRLRPGTQDWGRLRVSRLEPRVDIQAPLQAVREDSSEVRRR